MSSVVKTRRNDPYSVVVTPVNSAQTTPLEAPLKPADCAATPAAPDMSFDLMGLTQQHNSMSHDTNNNSVINDQSRSFMPTDNSRSFNAAGENTMKNAGFQQEPQQQQHRSQQKYRRGEHPRHQNKRQHRYNQWSQPGTQSLSSLSATPNTVSLTPTPAGGVAPPTCKVVAVNFKFDSNVFAAPFRVQVGDAVVVQWDETTQHIGIVATIFDSPLEGQPLPTLKLVRHAREEDEEAFSKLPAMNTMSTSRCQQAIDVLTRANQLSQSVAIVDTEWRLDHTSATILITSVSSENDMSLIHRSLLETLRAKVYLLTVDQYFSGNEH